MSNFPGFAGKYCLRRPKTFSRKARPTDGFYCHPSFHIGKKLTLTFFPMSHGFPGSFLESFWISIKKMPVPIIDERLFRLLVLGLPRLVAGEWSDLLEPLQGEEHLYKLFCKDEIYSLKENQGKKARQMGVRVENDGAIYLPIRLEEIIAYGQEVFKIKGIRTVDKESFEQEPVNGLEILFNSYLEIYRPYLGDTRWFDSEKTGAILKKRNITCPDFDKDRFSRCIKYALEVDWGRKL